MSGTRPPCSAAIAAPARRRLLRLGVEEAGLADVALELARLARARSRRPSCTSRKSAGVTRLTRTSVHCAERTSRRAARGGSRSRARSARPDRPSRADGGSSAARRLLLLEALPGAASARRGLRVSFAGRFTRRHCISAKLPRRENRRHPPEARFAVARRARPPRRVALGRARSRGADGDAHDPPHFRSARPRRIRATRWPTATTGMASPASRRRSGPSGRRARPSSSSTRATRSRALPSRPSSSARSRRARSDHRGDESGRIRRDGRRKPRVRLRPGAARPLARRRPGSPSSRPTSGRRRPASPPSPPYMVRTVAGVRVGILGLTTPLIASWEPTSRVAGLRFEDSVEAATRYVPVLRGRERCDLVVVLAHEGFERGLESGEERGTGDENQAYAIATKVPGIDLLLTGHTHTVIEPRRLGTTWVSQPGRFGNAVDAIRCDPRARREGVERRGDPGDEPADEVRRTGPGDRPPRDPRPRRGDGEARRDRRPPRRAARRSRRPRAGHRDPRLAPRSAAPGGKGGPLVRLAPAGHAPDLAAGRSHGSADLVLLPVREHARHGPGDRPADPRGARACGAVRLRNRGDLRQSRLEAQRGGLGVQLRHARRRRVRARPDARGRGAPRLSAARRQGGLRLGHVPRRAQFLPGGGGRRLSRSGRPVPGSPRARRRCEIS